MLILRLLIVLMILRILVFAPALPVWRLCNFLFSFLIVCLLLQMFVTLSMLNDNDDVTYAIISPILNTSQELLDRVTEKEEAIETQPQMLADD
jgi:hypothetical protein